MITDVIRTAIRKNQPLRLFLRKLRSSIINVFVYRVGSVDSTNHLQLGSSISRDLIMGSYSYIGSGAWICPKVTMGNYVMLAPNVVILGGDHNYHLPGKPVIFSGRPSCLKKTIVEDDVWIGYGAIINAGVRIGMGAVVAAGAVVTRDVP